MRAVLENQGGAALFWVLLLHCCHLALSFVGPAAWPAARTTSARPGLAGIGAPTSGWTAPTPGTGGIGPTLGGGGRRTLGGASSLAMGGGPRSRRAAGGIFGSAQGFDGGSAFGTRVDRSQTPIPRSQRPVAPHGSLPRRVAERRTGRTTLRAFGGADERGGNGQVAKRAGSAAAEDGGEDECVDAAEDGGEAPDGLPSGEGSPRGAEMLRAGALENRRGGAAAAKKAVTALLAAGLLLAASTIALTVAPQEADAASTGRVGGSFGSSSRGIGSSSGGYSGSLSGGSSSAAPYTGGGYSLYDPYSSGLFPYSAPYAGTPTYYTPQYLSPGEALGWALAPSVAWLTGLYVLPYLC